MLINTIKTSEKNIIVTYSGHESGLAVSYAATVMNITSLERHNIKQINVWFRSSSFIEIGELRSLVRAVRSIESAMGDGHSGC